MLVTFMVGSFIRYRKKQWWLFAKDSRGDVRVNIFLVFQLVLSIYSGTWIAVIAFSTSSTVRPTATLVLQLVVFLPLAFSGFGEVFALVTALPSTRLMVSFAGAPTRLSRFQTALESRGLLDLLSIGCPVGMLASVIPLSVMAGISQFRLQRDWAVVATALEGAVRTGWTPEALQETLVGLQTLSKQTTPFYWIRFVAAAYVFWTVVHQILYLPATFFVYKLLTEQKRYLHNSMMNAAALQSITSADLSGYRSPTFTGTDFGVRSPSGLSTGKEHSDVDRSGSKTSMASTCVEVGVPAPLSLAAKLKAVKINRQLTVLQLVVSEFIALGLLGFSIFNACDGLAKVSLALGREIYILVPTYTFLIMQRTARPPHPSSLPLLLLVTTFTLPSASLPVLDPLIELALAFIYEDEHPQSLKDWLLRVTAVEPKVQTKKVAADIEEKILLVVQGGPDKLHDWFHDIKNLYPQSDEDEGPINEAPLHRASPTAIFIRRCRLAFFRMSFDASMRWWDDVTAWCAGQWTEPDRRTVGTRMAEAYLKAKMRMDYQAARDATGYYDLDDGSPNQCKPQYALLNMAFLEHELGGLTAARAGDFGLEPRDEELDPEPQRELVGSGRPSPTDLLWSIKRDSAAGEPLPLLFATLISSRAMYHSPLSASVKDKGRIATWNDPAWEASWHAVSGIVWSDMGSPTLSSWRETLALNSIDNANPAWNVRLPVLAQRSVKLTRNGQYDEALQLLLRSVDTRAKRQNMGVLEFGAWERQVWDVVLARAESKGQVEVVSHIKRLSPPSPAHWTSEPPADADPSATELLQKGSRFLDQSQPTLALPFLLQALRLATLRSSEPVHLDVVEAATLAREAFAGYSRLGLTTDSLRACTLLAHLCDHLATADPTWIDKRNAVASEYLVVARRCREMAVPTEAEWNEVREIDGIVKAVERAVLATIAVA
ncbi:hypothetical protein RQP46_009871 [Phenoliferia psychrophenolica]